MDWLRLRLQDVGSFEETPARPEPPSFAMRVSEEAKLDPYISRYPSLSHYPCGILALLGRFDQDQSSVFELRRFPSVRGCVVRASLAYLATSSDLRDRGRVFREVHRTRVHRVDECGQYKSHRVMVMITTGGFRRRGGLTVERSEDWHTASTADKSGNTDIQGVVSDTS